jgi:class 3 adenylate cyclase
VARLTTWLRIATDRVVVLQACATTLFVGLLVTSINHGDEILSGRLLPGTPLQIGLTFLVPYLVSTVTNVVAIERQTRGEEAHLLLERQIEAIHRFPDQNPNPVMRTTLEGELVYANTASAPILEALGIGLGETFPPDVLHRVVSATDGDRAPVEIQSGWRTFALTAVQMEDLAVVNLYGTDVTASKVIAKFPDQNPNPVLRMDTHDTLIYANAASNAILSALHATPGDPVPDELLHAIRSRLSGESNTTIEVSGEGRSFAITPVPILEFGFTNLYGTDVTALHAINKFPDENPNPVLRVSRDGTLTYANPASELVRRAWGVEVGQRLPNHLFGVLTDAADGIGPNTIEATSEGRIFALLVVAVFEFESINVYGTDVTAARQIERANAENERLLLNILPASIADRLRQGEVVIADRFEEMAVVFADVVDFTPFAGQLPATEVVAVLNQIFSIFDQLADRYRLEKIKTIGDAYMMVGGLDEEEGHVERAADAALELIAEMTRYRTTDGKQLQIRVGLHVGPTVGGVIGLKKFIYDVWGDTVNMASRMESHGVAGRVQVAESTCQRLQSLYRFEPRGMVDVKGKGPMATYLLVGRREPAEMTGP